MSKAQGFVYFIRGGEHVKIGWSRDIAKRMRQLQGASSTRLSLLGCLEGTRETEADLHQRFKRLRRHGEWFAADEKMLAAIRWFCDESAQAALREAELARCFRQVLVDALNSFDLLARQQADDVGQVSMYRRLARAALDRYHEQFDALATDTESKRQLRCAEMGYAASECVNPPKRPTAKELADFGRANYHANVARDVASRPPYLDPAAIFDDEAPDGDPVAQAMWDAALGAA